MPWHSLVRVVGGGSLVAYLPDARLLVEADLYDPPADPQTPPTAASAANRSLYRHVQRLGLDVETIVPIHGQPAPWSDLASLVGR